MSAVSVVSARYAVLAMYPFASLQAAWDGLYSAASIDIADAPAGLRWDLDVHGTWLDPDLAIGMACGWPLVKTLRDSVRVVGTFGYDASEPGSHLYRSVIVARSGSAGFDQLHSERAAINSTDSLSGYISLMSAFDRDAGWGGATTYTGSHTASIAALRAGVADVAAIDGVTWSYLARDLPETIEGLIVLGNGPAIPGLPIIVPAGTSDAVVEAWRDGLRRAVAAPESQPHVRRLMIRSFVALDNDDYSTDLADLRRRYLVPA